MDVDRRAEARCVAIVFNPASGSGDAEARREAIREALAARGYDCQFFLTAPDVEVATLTRDAVQRDADLIVVAGGDGTVIQVLSSLIDTDVPVAIIPSGTGNLLALNLDIPTSISEAVNVALEGSPYPIDLARVRVRPVTQAHPIASHVDEHHASAEPPRDDWKHFAVMGGVGLDARMVRDADVRTKRTWGVLAYVGAILNNLRKRSTYVTVTIDGGRPIRRRTETVLVANMGKIMGKLAAFPQADPADGVLDIGLIMPNTLGEWLRLLFMAILGRPHDAPGMDAFRGKRITIQTSSLEPFELDGEICGYTDEMTIEIVPRAVRVLRPAELE